MSRFRFLGGWIALFGVVLGAGACELVDVTLPEGEDVLVVEGILWAGDSTQRILLHRTIDGGVIQGESGARVTVITPGGGEIPFLESSRDACFLLEPQDTVGGAVNGGPTCYLHAGGGDFVRPGATYELRIETTRGERIRGRTQVPGAFALRSPTIPQHGGPQPVFPGGTQGPTHNACTLRPNTVLPLVWSPAPGAWGYLSAMEVVGLRRALPGPSRYPDPLKLTGVSVSESDTTMLLPTHFGLFQRGSLNQDLLLLLQQGLPAGVQAYVIIAAADRNYINSVRGGSFHPSGNVRFSSVVGDGAGVFGSLVPLRLHLRVEQSPSMLEPFCIFE